MEGSVLPAFKSAFIAALQARVPNVLYGSPIRPEEFNGGDGSKLIAFWGDEAQCSVDVPVLNAVPVTYDEVVTPVLIIQAIGNDTDDTQEVLDQRVSEVLGHAVAILADYPQQTPDTTWSHVHHALYAGGRWITGAFEGTDTRAGRFEADIEIHARLYLSED